MTLELKVPLVGESIAEVEVGQWFKGEGSFVKKDENLVALESEKATVELPAPSDGVLTKILKRHGQKAAVGETIGHLDPTGTPEPKNSASSQESSVVADKSDKTEAKVPEAGLEKTAGTTSIKEAVTPLPSRPASPAGLEEVVPMTPLRRAVAQRLVEARQTMAMLTTFNEIDMSAVATLRRELQDAFSQKYGIKLGFMSFFVKAAIDGLKLYPQLNASVRGSDIVYHNYFDIGIAVASSKGLAVPVLRGADRLSFAETERVIADFGSRARENKLKPDELQEGTFTITNGGVFGSLLSTPIVNPPQSGILGMHSIQDRPVALDGAVVIRPMMFVALSYDHRIVDGREAVLFLRRIKEVIEKPARLLLEV
jgi:2-oxoglutarate dehydrogenase E2 component (dihydrolipoamide succinyltransferase)